MTTFGSFFCSDATMALLPPWPSVAAAMPRQ
jgi:hypothetical protein